MRSGEVSPLLGGLLGRLARQPVAQLLLLVLLEGGRHLGESTRASQCVSESKYVSK